MPTHFAKYKNTRPFDLVFFIGIFVLSSRLISLLLIQQQAHLHHFQPRYQLRARPAE